MALSKTSEITASPILCRKPDTAASSMQSPQSHQWRRTLPKKTPNACTDGSIGIGGGFNNGSSKTTQGQFAGVACVSRETETTSEKAPWRPLLSARAENEEQTPGSRSRMVRARE